MAETRRFTLVTNANVDGVRDVVIYSSDPEEVKIGVVPGVLLGKFSVLEGIVLDSKLTRGQRERLTADVEIALKSKAG